MHQNYSTIPDRDQTLFKMVINCPVINRPVIKYPEIKRPVIKRPVIKCPRTIFDNVRQWL